MEKLTHTDALRYRDTRGRDTARPTFSDAVLRGMAEGGGLYVPEEVPALSLEDIVSLAEVPYYLRAARIYEAFKVDLPQDRIEALFKQAYGSNFDHPSVAPVRRIAHGLHVLELWHGPTAAFKDMALQAMPLFFGEAVANGSRAGGLRPAQPDGVPSRYLILVATSGDTGKAALEGFADRERTAIVVFYPEEGVSELQRLQMVTQRGENVGVFGVRGNFDDCQAAVKTAFADVSFNELLLHEYGVSLSSANSINWGRLLPQVAYYVSAYADLVAAGALLPGEAADFCVPTGNFGNILAGYYARRLGVPIARLLCASNENRVLADFLASGVYDLRGRQFVMTPSPSMDILVSSNLERALFEISGDPGKVSAWMSSLKSSGYFAVDSQTLAELQEIFTGGWVSNEESLATIRSVHSEYGYLLDPHTAVAWRLAEKLREDRPMVVVGTAHWAKFGSDVLRALEGTRAGDGPPEQADRLNPRAVLERVLELAPGERVPESLRNLFSLPVRFDEVVDGDPEAVKEAVRRFLERPSAV
ncbi:MAG: threonine synthase [Thermoleophilia bacterium]